MTSGIASPRVFAVDDDLAQRHVLNAILHGEAVVDFFSEPHAALASLQPGIYDAAIVDVHLRRSPLDGFDVARRIRAIDPFLSIVIYTGDDSPAVLEESLDVRAIRRVLKASSKSALVSAIKECAEETRAARVRQYEAALGRETQRHLKEEAKSAEFSRTTADFHRAMFSTLANDLTGLGVAIAAARKLAEQIPATDTKQAERENVVHAIRHALVGADSALARLNGAYRRINLFSDGLLGQENRAQVNDAVEAACNILKLDPRLAGRKIQFHPSDMEPMLPTSQLALLSGLRGTAHFLLDTCDGNVTGFSMGVARVDGPTAMRMATEPAPLLLLNRNSLERAEFVHIRCACSPSALTPDKLTPALAEPPAAGRLYPLVLLAGMLSAVVAIQRTKTGAVVEILFPG